MDGINQYFLAMTAIVAVSSSPRIGGKPNGQISPKETKMARSEFASADFTVGQLNALVKVVGAENVMGILRGEMKVTIGKSDLLKRVATAIANGAKKFVANEECLKEANVGWTGNNFRESFLGKVEENILDASLTASRLEENSLDGPILAELGTRAEISLAHMFDLFKKQSKGQAGVLLTNGSANIFYIRDVKGNLWAVRADWYSGLGYWLVEARSVEHQYGWYAGYLVFARD